MEYEKSRVYEYGWREEKKREREKMWSKTLREKTDTQQLGCCHFPSFSPLLLLAEDQKMFVVIAVCQERAPISINSQKRGSNRVSS